MLTPNRRLGVRVPLQMLLTQYVNDKPIRALTSNVSEHGLHLNQDRHTPFCRDHGVVGLEFELPGTGEVIWARGEVCHDQLDPYFHGSGVRLTGIPMVHARLLRDYCIERRRAHLGSLLQRIRHASA